MSTLNLSGSSKQKNINVIDKIRTNEVHTAPLENIQSGTVNVLLQLVKPFKGLFAIDVTTYAVATILNGLLPFIMGLLIDSLQIDFNHGVFIFSENSLTMLFVFLGTFATSILLYRLNALNLSYFEPGFRASSRARLTDYTLSRSVQFLSDKFAGRLAHAINEISRATQSIIDHIRWSMIEPFLTALILMLTAMTVHLYFSILLIVWLVIFVIGVMSLTLGLQKMIEELADKRGHGSALITDSIVNFISVKMFASRKYEMKLLCEALDDEIKSSRKFLLAVFRIKLYQAFLEIILLGAASGLIWHLWQTQAITIGQVSMILSSCVMITAYLWNFSSQIIAFTEDMGSCDESLQQIHEDRDQLKMSKYENFTPQKGEIVFDNLSFAYNAETPLFKGFQLHIKAGERVGIVGRSGSGKSTLVKLLLRFYDVDNEEIYIDRQNITNIGYASLRQNIAVIPQDASLFNRSVLENIRYGRLDATDEDVMEAAKKAQAHKFITELPDGYNTMLGDRGTKLSGGQRQRVAIARAILKDAQILVLDEATSALDSESELLVQKALDVVMEGRTVVAIAHRLSTLSNMNRIIVLEEGDLVEDGSHEELLAKKGRYYDLWNMQSGNFVDTSDED